MKEGADEIIYQPFSFRELVLKMKILEKREKNNPQKSRIYQIDDLFIDPDTFTAKRGGKQIYLRRKEFDLLCFLFQNEGRVITKLTILEAVWDCNADLLTNTLEVHIVNLRRKIDEGYPSNRRLIHTTYGRGYRFGLTPTLAPRLSAKALLPST